jgi:diguanylate cyclase (GGDEF)-like protein
MKNKVEQTRRLAFWSRVSAVGLTLVLLGHAAFGPWASHRMNDEATELDRASATYHSFKIADAALNEENRSEKQFKRAPNEATLSRHGSKARDLEFAMRNVISSGNNLDQSNASDVLDSHRRYIEATNRLFSAVAAHRSPATIIEIDRSSVAPAFSRTMNRIKQIEDQLKSALVIRGSDFQLTDRFITILATAISLLGLICLGVFFYILEAYRRRTAEVHRESLTRLEEAALTDNLTGLGNHRAFQEDLRREFSRAARYDEALSLALIDIDDMKVMNASRGHQRGDELLVGVATLLQRLKAEDRAFRIGGDEFAVLLTNTVLEDAKTVMERLRLEAQELGGAGVSIGVASCHRADTDPESVRSRADAALYAAKRGGRNAVEAFHEEKNGMWMLSSTKVHNLHQLIAEGEMRVAFQPIWDVKRCNVLGYEALARPDEKYGFRGPQDAFDLAERIGKSHQLDRVCRSAILARADELPADKLLFINICPQALDHQDFDAAKFARLVGRAGLTPERVIVEITERAVAGLDIVVAAAEALRRSGFRLALDDTGAGNSGLEMLSKLPVDFVKIDRTIIVKALENTGARGVLVGIIAIARAIGAYVIAEGIEDEQLLRFVCSPELGEVGSRGVSGVQGYLLRRPSEDLPDRAALDGIRAMLHNVGLGPTIDTLCA